MPVNITEEFVRFLNEAKTKEQSARIADFLLRLQV